MRVLAITNMYPTPQAPASGVFIEQQIKGLQATGVGVHVLFIDRRREGTASYYRMEPRIQAAVSESAPDLIHVMYGGVMADRVTSMKGLPPVVVTFHGSDLLGENLSGLVRKVVAHYGVLCSKRAALRAAGVVVVARHLLPHLPSSISESIPGISGFMPQSSAPRSFRIPLVRVIPCGIDLGRFQPLDPQRCRRKLNWADDVFHVLFVSANNDPVKRPELAAAAIARLKTLGVKTDLHLLQGVPNSQVPEWFSASHALLLTSLHEGSPTVVKEALASRLPVVSVDIGDVTELIEGVVGCYLAEPDPMDLAQKLNLVRASSRRLEMGGRLDGLSHISTARKLEQFYGEIMAKPSSCVPATCQSYAGH